MMSLKTTSQTIQLADGRVILLESGLLARQAHGAVMVSMGKARLLATVVMKQEEASVDFLPLSVDYQESFAAAGKIPGGFLKREGKLNDHEVRVARLVDRALRPRFPKGFCNEVQVNIVLHSADKQVQADSLAALAASAALTISPIPFNGPISEVRVARVGTQLHINPDRSMLAQADMELIVAASEEGLLMVEGEMKEVDEEHLLEAIEHAHQTIKLQCQAQRQFAERLGIRKEACVVPVEDQDPVLEKKLRQVFYQPCYAVAKKALPTKAARKNAFEVIKKDYLNTLLQEEQELVDTKLIDTYFTTIRNQAIRDLLLQENLRLDGRVPDEIRDIDIEVDYLPAAHGSALFTRGETQALASVTLGSQLDEQMIDEATESGYKKLILHYNFPGFCTGEVKPNRGVSRREIGHANLILRGIKNMIPNLAEGPTIRMVSNILESNGSSSMASVCAVTHALMDAGVQVSKLVSGIAMGLVLDSKLGRDIILSDISGEEDQLGDMDFKITGTKNGITACQMDIKAESLSYEVLRRALAQAKKGRLHILQVMAKRLSKSRPTYKPHAPAIHTMQIPLNMIGAVIGPKGKTIQDIQASTGATINVDQTPGHGVVSFFAPNQAALDEARKQVERTIEVPVVGKTYLGKVKSVTPWGAFLEFLRGKQGLLHISEWSHERIIDMEKELKVGQELTIQLIKIEEKNGKFSLSRKSLLQAPKENNK